MDPIFREISMSSIQGLLLLQMYTLHNKSSGLRLWSLHYHSLSFVSELGIFQNMRGTKFFSPFEEEMRTRIFWTVYCMDRLLSTLKGRPEGLTDDTCHLRVSWQSIWSRSRRVADFCSYHLTLVMRIWKNLILDLVFQMNRWQICQAQSTSSSWQNLLLK